jgi:hypothetical protein
MEHVMTDVETDLTGFRVLLVEDNGLLGRCLADALMDFGAQVLGPIPDLAEAFRCLSARHPELNAAVLNVTIGTETSFRLVDLADGLGVPCLFVTGYAAEDIPARYGHVPLFEKPVESNAFAACVAETARRSLPRR